MSDRRNVNRGYQKLTVWQDAADLYVLTCKIFRKLSYELRRVAANQIASVDSVHRNIAEGYCRRSLNEYLQFLNVAQASLGESVSGAHVYRRADQISAAELEVWDILAYKLENGLKKLIESLQHKREKGEWTTASLSRNPTPRMHKKMNWNRGTMERWNGGRIE